MESYINHQSPQHVHILSNYRSGSTYLYFALRAYLNPYQPKHGNDYLSCYEPFSFDIIKKCKFDNDIVTERMDSFESAILPYVISVHTPHLITLKDKYPSAYDRFTNLNLHTIVLLRRSIFDVALSLCISEHTNQLKTYPVAYPTINIDPGRLEAVAIRAARNQRKTVEVASQLGFDEVVYYEDLTFIPKVDYYNRGLCRTHFDMLPDVTIDKDVSKAPNKRSQVENYDVLFDVCQKALTNMHTR